jgi:tRNA (guanine37-N1)-methyltransferase
LKRRLRDVLADSLSEDILRCVHNSYDIIGDIAILRLTHKTKKHLAQIAEVIMSTHRNVKTVLVQTGPVHGDFRVRRFTHAAGKKRTTTVHRESGCLFHVDLEKCYFSPRLLHERMRIARQVENGESIINMFSGVGCFSIIIAKHSVPEKIYSIDTNPIAFDSMQKNIKMNGVYGRVLPLLGDAKEIIQKRLLRVADRVLMPLPEKAYKYLPYALAALKKSGGWIHYYDFEHAVKNENPVEKVKSKVTVRLIELGANFDFSLGRIVRKTGPNWYQVVLDIRITSENVL